MIRLVTQTSLTSIFIFDYCFLFHFHQHHHQAAADLSCGKVSQNVQNYQPNYQPLIDACLSISSRSTSTVSHIKRNINDMLSTMNSYNRFNPAIRKIQNNRNLKPEDKAKKLDELQKAIQNFFTKNRETADKYIKQTDTDAAKLDVMQFYQKCPQILQDYSTKQATSASSLMNVPSKFCTDMNTVFNTFQSTVDGARAKL